MAASGVSIMGGMDASEVFHLLSLARSGNAAAAQRLFELLALYLEAQAPRYAYLVRPQYGLSDLVQLAGLRLWEGLEQFQGSREEAATLAQFRDWIGTTLFRAACNLHREGTAKRRRPARLPRPVGPAHSSDGTGGAEPPDSRRSPSSSARAEEAARLVSAALDALPKEQREIVKLHFFDGLSLDEIAARMGVSYDRVRGPFRAAKKRLKRDLGILQ